MCRVVNQKRKEVMGEGTDYFMMSSELITGLTS